MKRGLSPEEVQNALSEVEIDEPKLIQELLRYRYPGFDPGTTPYAQKQKIYRFLVGRGFQGEHIKRALFV